MTLHTFDVELPDLLNGLYDPTGTPTRTSAVKTHFVVPGPMTCIDFANPSNTNSGLTGQGVRFMQGATDLEIRALDANGDATANGINIGYGGKTDILGTFCVNGVPVGSAGIGAPANFGGDGTDGATTISSNTSVTGTTNATTLTVNSTIEYHTEPGEPAHIQASTSLTNNGIINADGKSTHP